MAKVVAAMAMMYGPGLTGWFDQAPEGDRELVRGCTRELRRRLEAARPDVLVMLSNDHLLNWPINNVPSWTVSNAGNAGASAVTSASDGLWPC